MLRVESFFGCCLVQYLYVAGVGDNLSRFMNGGDVRINVIL